MYRRLLMHGKTWRQLVAQRTLVLVLILLEGLLLPISGLAQAPPATLQALEKQGFVVVGTFPSAAGLTAWAGYMNQQPVALYATPDGKHLIAGTLLDAEGNDIDHEILEKTVNGSMTARIWGQLQQSHWIADGADKAPRIVYVFTDPNGPYCNKFWSDARPWVSAGKVQLRHVMVGILTPTSPAKAAALLTDKKPAALLASYEQAQVAATTKALASGQPRPLSDDGLKLLSPIPAAVQAQLNSNVKLMTALGMRATPALVWRDAGGNVQTRVGLPGPALADIMGPLK